MSVKSPDAPADVVSKRVKTKYYIRRTHRYLGLIIGIQFLAWTLGGLYFSWSDMDEVHGDYEKAPQSLFAARSDYVFPVTAIESLRQSARLDSLADLRLVSILGKTCWQITYFSPVHAGHHKKHCLVDALSGNLRLPLSESEALEVAKMAFIGGNKVLATKLLTNTNGHHEYRGGPLPALAVQFDDPRRTTVYVSTELGTVQKFRNRPWRRFDFLWMLHTMDYSERDNISNWLLRAFSVLGLLTVCSGFLLFFTSLKRKTI